MSNVYRHIWQIVFHLTTVPYSRHFDFASGPTGIEPASLHHASASALH